MDASSGALPMALDEPESGGRGDVVYADAGAGPMDGFAEPARDPGPEAPADGDGGVAEEDPAAAAEALVGLSLAEAERLVIEATIRACGGSLPKAARVLGVSPSTLYRKRANWTD
ncbi:MAG: helix-turn-helix domain-containing protein [Paracoccaceae bacterium]